MASRRIDVLCRQLTASTTAEPCGTAAGFSPREMAKFLCHDNEELRERIYEFLKDELYRPNHYLSLMEFRELTLQRLQKFAAAKFFSIRDYLNDPRKFMAALESLTYCDYSLTIKAGVHFTLCGGTVCKLGTAKHHEAILPRIDSLDLTGSFSMTELGHGSNVMGIETTATYDASSQEFIIHTPTNEASKIWIGGTGQHGKVTVVFAQLTVNGKWEGPHVFVVRIRDDNMNVMPGIRIRDMGPKMGLNGVDNGQLWFDHVRVSRDALLDAFASVGEDGVYRSKIPSVSQRFGTMVGGLTTGRVLIGQSAIDAQKLGVTIALRYAATRPQFGDKLIINYLTHQNRLLPALATAYAQHLAMGKLKSIMDLKRPEDGKLVHIVSSGLKAAATWSKTKVLQDCRECCGGMGFLSSNKIGPMHTDMNVDVTFEGDNTVLMQQVARGVVEDKRVSGSAPEAPGVVLCNGGATTENLLKLLAFREKHLAHRIASQMAAEAAKAAASGGKDAAARAAAAAFDSNLDLVVALGWANVERFCTETFMQSIERAPQQLRSPLALLARLYAATCVQKDAATFLAAGAFPAPCAAALRDQVHAMYGQLVADDCRLALALCDSFAIPAHLLDAPIANDWRMIGLSS